MKTVEPLTLTKIQILQDIDSIEPAFRIRLLQRLRQELGDIIEGLPISDSKKQYLIHQIPYCHDFDHMLELADEINYLSAHNLELPQILLSRSETGLNWVRHFSRAMH